MMMMNVKDIIYNFIEYEIKTQTGWNQKKM